MPDAPCGAQMSDQRADEPLGADKQPSPRVAQGEPVPAAGVPRGAAEFSSASFAAGADDVTVAGSAGSACSTWHGRQDVQP